MVHTEVVLQGDRGECLCSGLYLYTFLSLDRLVQAIGITTSVHDTTRLLVNDLHLTVDNHVFVVFLEHGVSFQQLVDGMYTLALDGIVRQYLVLLGLFLFLGSCHILQLG